MDKIVKNYFNSWRDIEKSCFLVCFLTEYSRENDKLNFKVKTVA